MSGNKFYLVLVALVIGILSVAVIAKNNRVDDAVSLASSQGSQNYYGNLDSPVTVTEFVDFQCEACYAYYPAVKEVKEMYKDQVRFQVRNFPIVSGHQFAMQAARSAEAAALQGKYWEMHDKIFEGQKLWEREQNPETYFDQYAEDIGLDMEKYRTDKSSSAVLAKINKDLADVKEIGGSGTPTFAVNGNKIENPGPSVEALSAMIDNALEEAGITPDPVTANL